MSIPTMSSAFEFVVLLESLLLERDRASIPQHIIELINPKVNMKGSKLQQTDIGILFHKQTCKPQRRETKQVKSKKSEKPVINLDPKWRPSILRQDSQC